MWKIVTVDDVKGNNQMINYHDRDKCRFLLRTDLTSLQNRRASSIGSRQRRAVSRASLNHDLIGMAFSGYIL
uniref:Uncharacterized protein n=1 Tax=Arion vulgaris TaxID=1028688 RepID=A0A0B6Y0D2_9EUPU